LLFQTKSLDNLADLDYYRLFCKRPLENGDGKYNDNKRLSIGKEPGTHFTSTERRI